MCNVLALDLGSATGFCIFSCDEENIHVLSSGTKKFHQNGTAPLGRRFVCFRDWLRNIIKKHDIGEIFYEQVYAHSGIQPAHVYGGFLYHMAAICDDFNIALHGIGVCTIKKRVSGFGHASKAQIIKKVREYNFNPIDDNEADAIAIMLAVTQHGDKHE